MVRENVDRNLIIYELWKKGRTIDDISFDTGIPRSTVGYYVRKFNKRARRGEPIAFLPEREKPDEKNLAFTAFGKNIISQGLLNWLGEGKDGIEKAYKFLLIAKLVKELQRDIFPTIEEEKALAKHRFYILKQIMNAMVILPKTETKESDPLSDKYVREGRIIEGGSRGRSRPFKAIRGP